MPAATPSGQIEFALNLSREQFMRYYRGSADAVVARSPDGRTVRFPARLLRPFVSHDGVQGRFRLRFQGHRLLDLNRV